MRRLVKQNLVVVFLLVVSFSYGQKRLADRFFKNFDYLKASELYEKAIQKGDSSKHVLTRAGDCYWNNSDPINAGKWYKSAVEKYTDIDSKYVYRYIQTQLSVNNYPEVDKWRSVYTARYSDTEDYLPLGNSEELKSLTSTKGKYIELENLDINSKYSDFGPYVFKGKLYFTSARRQTDKVYGWNEEPYLDIYKASLNGEQLSQATPMAGNINTAYHESSIAITSDDSTLYFTRVNLKKRDKLNPDKEGTTRLTLYKATRNPNGRWIDITRLPFNDDRFSTGHPALSPDNKKLYFISDRDGGYGGTDIYYVDITPNGYSQPVNLGPLVNTQGREMFPHVSSSNELYFSSDGFVGIGLLDVFKTNYLNDKDARVENLGAPVNSGYDDFAYFSIDADQGYFASNRTGGQGSDDIYRFKYVECAQNLIVKAVDSETNAPLQEVTIELIDEEGVVVQNITTDSKTSYSIPVECDKTYKVLVKKDNYKDALQEITSSSSLNDTEQVVSLSLESLIQEDEIVIKPIYFDFDKWDIREDAQFELEHVVNVLRSNPTMVIQLESHTDSRGRDAYNMKLSDRRAKSTRDYLLSRGIDSKQIESARGYGESQLLNACSNGVECTEEAHQLNRRSVFKILRY
jgi:outer membrane protein OmpA-like peptidoglycan-associated protein/tetratricopeptide (TPR) repeat protein